MIDVVRFSFFLQEKKGLIYRFAVHIPLSKVTTKLSDVFFSPSLRRNLNAENTDRRVKVMSLFCPAAKEHLVQLHRVLMCVYVPSTNADGLLRASEGERCKSSSRRILLQGLLRKMAFFLTFRKPTLVWVCTMFALVAEA